MNSINGGQVVYGDGVKAPQEYTPPKKAEVTLRFDVREGEDHTAILNHASALAMAKVDEMLGRKPVSAFLAPGATGKVEHGKSAQVAEHTAPKAKTKADLAAEAGVLDEGTPPAKKAAPTEDDFTTAAETPVTDEELTKACGTTVARLKDKHADGAAVLVRGTIAKFNTANKQGFNVREITQPERHKFLEELKKLA